MSRLLQCLAVVPIALSASLAAAQTAAPIPEIKGTWVGQSHSIVMGGGGHHGDNPQPADKPFLVEREFTLIVEGQDRRRFWGTTVSSHARERFVGVMRADAKGFTGVDGDGTFFGEWLSRDSFEICYAQNGAHANKSVVASCTTFRKR